MKSHLEETLAYHILLARLPKPEREFKAIAGRRFRFDFAWKEQRLLVEVNGGTWKKGAHSSGAGIERDTEKANLATIRGWRVISVTGSQVQDGRAIQWIREALGEVA